MRDRRRPKTSKQLGKEFQNYSIQLPPAKIEGLLYQLCVELGFCLDSKLHARLVHSPPKNPQSFAEVVMKAEGFSPANSELYEKVFARVYKAFLAELSDDCC